MRIGTLKRKLAADAALFDLQRPRRWLAAGRRTAGAFVSSAGQRLPAVPGPAWSVSMWPAAQLNIPTGLHRPGQHGAGRLHGLGAYTVAIMQARWGTPFC